MIDIWLNGDKRQVEATTISHFLMALGLAGQSVAVAINDTVVPSSQHPTTSLSEGDRVEIVRPMGGG